MEHRYGLDRLLECYPLPNVRRLTIEHRIQCFSIKNDVPSALLSYPLSSLTLNIQLYRYEDLYELLMCYPTLKHPDTSFADVLDMNQWYPRKPDADLLEITQRFICNAFPRLHLTNRLEVHCKVL
ncbi:uncharacterized protein BT62DRAFT_935165 [Guyanagaster necrorhizus]|uniref:Uncharacterized protein n=1 Tax=Guyanagaster necrorhizus TaxID=856835 RepID=A0A9P8APD0_9AGAR|nr:uncharacterized protein BT62DRAFT_935165 [Guyanagaster necrorhizus MCA 3950]KAG7443208.1 hypothetical protein BT62DRAFT_935165 [Guyanagaster necrorhizus MCA 3950]